MPRTKFARYVGEIGLTLSTAFVDSTILKWHDNVQIFNFRFSEAFLELFAVSDFFNFFEITATLDIINDYANERIALIIYSLRFSIPNFQNFFQNGHEKFSRKCVLFLQNINW